MTLEQFVQISITTLFSCVAFIIVFAICGGISYESGLDRTEKTFKILTAIFGTFAAIAFLSVAIGAWIISIRGVLFQ